jgi:hypothetical protein
MSARNIFLRGEEGVKATSSWNSDILSRLVLLSASLFIATYNGLHRKAYSTLRIMQIDIINLIIAN